MTILRSVLLAGCVSVIAPTSIAFAQEQNSGASTAKLEEVIVTAQKRAENIQDVPLSIVAVSGDQLTSQGVRSPADLQKIVPNLTITPISQAAGLTLRVRGFGTSSNAAIDPDVAPYLDGIYLPRPGVLLSSFLDVNNVEVLRGPQGTLFGRNATVGALDVRTNQPSFKRQEFDAQGSVASYGAYEMKGVANIPVTDTFALRGAILANTSDGYVNDVQNGQTYGGTSTVVGRLSAKWNITPNLSWTGRLDDSRTTGAYFAYGAVDVSSMSAAQVTAFNRLGAATPTLADPATFNANQRFDDPHVADKQFGLASDLSWSFAGDFTLRLIDSYRYWQNAQTDGDVVFTGLDLLNRHAYFSSRSQSHELQFISPKDKLLNGRLNFVAGLYYFNEYYNIDNINDLGSQYCADIVAVAKSALLAGCNASRLNGAVANQFNQIETSMAAYAQADFKILQNLVFTLGGRETDDKKTGSLYTQVNNPGGLLLAAAESDPSLSLKKSAPTWRTNLSWTLRPGLLAFASYSTGYKSGGFNSAAASPALTPATRTFQDETSDDYELGIKSTFLQRRVLVNFDIYQTDIKNFQDRSFNGLSFIIRNAGNIRARGAELDTQVRLLDHFKLDASASYNDSIYSLFNNAPGLPACTGAATSCPTLQNLTGRTADASPRWQADGGLEYDSTPFAGGYVLQLRPDVSFESAFFATNDLNPQAKVKAHTLLGAHATLLSPTGRYSVTLYGTNLTDQRYFLSKFQQTLAGPLGLNAAATGATVYRGYLGEPIVIGARLSAKF